MSTYDSYGMTDPTAVAGGIVAGAVVVILIVVLIAVAIAALAIIGQWKAFKKAGKGGWEAIIPVYNLVVACQISGVTPWWILVIFIAGMLSAIPVIGGLISFAATLYFLVILYVSVSRSFGKSDGFAAGLYFLGPIFWLILGGKNTQYVGAKPMNDPVMAWAKKTFGGNNNQNAQPNNGASNGNPAGAMPATKFCTGCGNQVANGERFCPSCGREIQ